MPKNNKLAVRNAPAKGLGASLETWDRALQCMPALAMAAPLWPPCVSMLLWG